MSYSAKNYFEQGGDRLVIGGDVAFKEGAGVSGFPSDAAFLVFDLNHVDVSEIMQTPLDVTALFPVDQFERAAAGEKPVLFKNAELNGYRYTVLSTASDGENMVVGMAGMPFGFSGALSTIVTVILFRDDDRIYLRANSNEHLAAPLINTEEAPVPEETERSVSVAKEAAKKK